MTHRNCVLTKIALCHASEIGHDIQKIQAFRFQQKDMTRLRELALVAMRSQDKGSHFVPSLTLRSYPIS